MGKLQNKRDRMRRGKPNMWRRMKTRRRIRVIMEGERRRHLWMGHGGESGARSDVAGVLRLVGGAEENTPTFEHPIWADSNMGLRARRRKRGRIAAR